MVRFVPSLVLVAGLVLIASPSAQSEPAKADAAPPTPRLDVAGDPLPERVLARLGTARFRHGGAVGFVAFGAQGKELVTVDKAHIVHVWAVGDGRELRHFNLSSNNNSSGSSSWSDGTIMVTQEQVGNGAPSVALSRNGEVMASLSGDGNLRLWDMATAKEIRQVPCQGGPQCPIVFSPDGKAVAIKGWDSNVRLFDTKTGKEMRQFNLQNATGQRFGWGGQGKSLTFSPDGKTLAAYEAEQGNMGMTSFIQIWDVETGKQANRLKIAENQWGNFGLAFAPDGKTLAIGCPDNHVRIRDVANGKELHQLDQDTNIASLAYSSDGKLLAIKPFGEAPVGLWDTATGKLVRKLGEPVDANANNFFWNGNDGQAEIAFSPDDKLLAVGSSKHGTIRLWDVATGKDAVPTSGHTASVRGLAISADGKTVTTWADDASFRQWERATGKEVRKVALPSGVSAPAVSPNGEHFAVGSLDGAVHIWDLAAGKEERTLQLQPKQQFNMLPGGAAGMAFSPDGKTLAVRHVDATLHRWALADGKEAPSISTRTEPEGQPAIIFYNGIAPGIAWTPDGSLIATVGTVPAVNEDVRFRRFRVGGNGEQVVRVWNSNTGKMGLQFDVAKNRITAVAISPDGRNVATATADGVVLWETVSGKERCQLVARPTMPNKAGEAKKETQPAPGLTCLAYSADGRYLAAGGLGRAIFMWDTHTGTKLGELTGHGGAITSLAFGPDAQFLVSGSFDTTSLVWDTADLCKAASPETAMLTDAQQNGHWEALAGADAAKALLSIRGLEVAPRDAVALFSRKLQPAESLPPGRLEELVKDLSNPVFETRQRAHEELERVGEVASPALKKVLSDRSPLDLRVRVEQLLADAATYQAPPDVLRALRALEVLEHIGTPEAREVVESMTKGAPGAWLTREAQATAARMDRKAAAR
jgi:WD40 repeat protein